MRSCQLVVALGLSLLMAANASKKEEVYPPTDYPPYADYPPYSYSYPPEYVYPPNAPNAPKKYPPPFPPLPPKPEVGSGACKLDFKVVYKYPGSDLTYAQNMCQKAQLFMKNLSAFKCEIKPFGDLPADMKTYPTFGGIDAYNGLFGSLSFTLTTGNNQLSAQKMKEFYQKLDQLVYQFPSWSDKKGNLIEYEPAYGLDGLSWAIQIPGVWLSSCCNDPPMRVQDSCNIGRRIFGSFVKGCPICPGMNGWDWPADQAPSPPTRRMMMTGKPLARPERPAVMEGYTL